MFKPLLVFLITNESNDFIKCSYFYKQGYDLLTFKVTSIFPKNYRGH